MCDTEELSIASISKKEIHREALAVRKRVLGAEHPDTLASGNNLGCAVGLMRLLPGDSEKEAEEEEEEDKHGHRLP